MVDVAQLVEHQIVVLGVVGSRPIFHPNGKRLPNLGGRFSFSPSGPDPYRLNDSSPLPRTLNKAGTVV